LPDAGGVRLVVFGVGNELMRDDGIGVRVARRLRETLADERVAVIEAGTAVLDALDLVPAGADVIVVDAASGGAPPGSVHRFGLDDLSARRGVSLHEVGLPEAVALARLGGAEFGNVIVLGVEPAAIEAGTELSPILEAKLPAILDAVRAEVARLLSS